MQSGRSVGTALVVLLSSGGVTGCGGIVGPSTDIFGGTDTNTDGGARSGSAANGGGNGSNDAGSASGGGGSGSISGDDDSGPSGGFGGGGSGGGDDDDTIDASTGDDDDLDATIGIDAGTSSDAGGTATLPTPGATTTIVTTEQRGAVALAADGTNVYWSDGRSIYAVPGTGGFNTLLSSTGSTSLGLDVTNVYFVDAHGVEKVTKTAGRVTNLYTTTHATAIAVVGTKVYWAEASPMTAAMPTVSVKSVNTDGTGATSLATVALGASPFSMVVVGSTAFLSGPGLVLLNLTTGAQITGPSLNCLTIATDGHNAFCTATGAGTIHRIDVSGNDTTIATSQAEPWGIASDGTDLYWSNNTTTGNVAGMVIGGAPAVTLVSDTNPTLVAADNVRVYWATSTAIKAFTKSP